MEGREIMNTTTEPKTVEERTQELERQATKKTEPEFLHVVIKGHVLTSLDACIFGAGFVTAFLVMIIF
jgi:hypothetical protein